MDYAAFRIRIYAFLLDYLVIVLYGVLVVGTISFVFRSYVNPLFSSSPATAELAGFCMITLPVSLYFILCECTKWQGTLGKRKMGIRVVDGAGHRIGVGRSVFRTAIKFLPWELAHFGIWRTVLPTDLSDIAVYVILYGANFILLLYLIIPLANKKRKNVYDWIAGTAVIR
jgi:uncharacterized RDD family membrane protein YckC